jgi:hypothetical protein
LGYELLGEQIEVVRPIRVSRNKVVEEVELNRSLELATLKLKEAGEDWRSLILILIDADQDLPCVFGPRLLDLARKARPDIEIACVVANVEYETWFVASAESLQEYLDLSGGEPPEFPEAARSGKGWIEDRFRGTKYSETLDQPAMTARMDLSLCRSRCPSFDKLCREIAQRLA